MGGAAGAGLALVLLAASADGAREEAASAQVLVASGTMSRSGVVELEPFLVLDGRAPETPSGRAATDYVFELLDREGAVLSRTGLDLTFEQEVIGRQGTEVREIEVTPWSLTVPLPPAAVRARLLRGAELLIERVRTASTPEVAITAVRISEDRVVDLRWRASDADGGALTYLVLYAPDGHSFESVAIDLETSDLRFDLDDLAAPPGAAAALRVRVSDGWNVSQATAPLGF